MKDTAAVLKKKQNADSAHPFDTLSGPHLEPSHSGEATTSTSSNGQHPPLKLRSKRNEQVKSKSDDHVPEADDQAKPKADDQAKPKTTPVRRVINARSMLAGGYLDEPTDINGSMQHLAEVRHSEDEAADLQTSMEASEGASPQERGQE